LFQFSRLLLAGKFLINTAASARCFCQPWREAVSTAFLRGKPLKRFAATPRFLAPD
jgi:hypothetical protein